MASVQMPFSPKHRLSILHLSVQYLHRGWKQQPLGKSAGLGGIPSMGISFLLSPVILGMDSNRPFVYGCSALRKTSSTVPYSTISPAYMMATLSHVSATTPKSWVTKSMAVFVF